MSHKYPKSGHKIIVKYSNRKLYDTQSSKYVTLPEVNLMTPGSYSIIDKVTGDDITNETLVCFIGTLLVGQPKRFGFAADAIKEILQKGTT